MKKRKGSLKVGNFMTKKLLLDVSFKALKFDLMNFKVRLRC